MARPSLAPLVKQELICSGCGGNMRPEVEKMGKKIVSITHYCRPCDYGFKSSPPYANGEMVRYSDGRSTEPREVLSPPESKPLP